MSPREFDAAVIQRRLVVMRELIADLAAVGEVTEARLVEDAMLRYAVERIVTQLVDVAVAINGHLTAGLLGRVPEDYRSSFATAADAGVIDRELAARLSLSVGLRNVLIHDYTSTDFDILARSVSLAVEGYSEYLRQVAGWLRDREG